MSRYIIRSSAMLAAGGSGRVRSGRRLAVADDEPGGPQAETAAAVEACRRLSAARISAQLVEPVARTAASGPVPAAIATGSAPATDSSPTGSAPAAPRVSGTRTTAESGARAATPIARTRSSGVAAEQLVAGVAREAHRHVLGAPARETRKVGICEESANGSSYISGSGGMTSQRGPVRRRRARCGRCRGARPRPWRGRPRCSIARGSRS